MLKQLMLQRKIDKSKAELEELRNKLNEIRDQYGPESIAGISTGQMTLEEMSLYGHVMRNYLKANVA